MFKRLSFFLALVFVLSMMVPMTGAFAEAMTDVGTPRAQTLICEPDDDVHPDPGAFNPYQINARNSWGGHQILYDDGLWEVNTMTGETIPTIAAELAEPNEDYTEWTVKIREGITWSDGEVLNANDVVFTLNMILTDEALNDHAYYNSLFSGVELIDDYTLKISCHKPFTRIMTTLGVNTWGCGFRVVPEKYFGAVDSVVDYKYPEAVFAGQYVVKDYDELGTWILYEKREDWQNTATGILYGEPGPQYVLYRVFGSAESRVMAAINNEVDVMNEVSYEDLKLMLAQNENVRGWYAEYPYANTDDACAKGIFFNTAIEPLNDVDVRWALTLCCNWIEVSENIFEGIGRMSALSIPAVSAQVDFYYEPMQDWLSNEFTIVDGYNPWNPNFALELAAALQEDLDIDLSMYNDEQLIDIFGTGFWKTDVEKATAILEAKEGFELKDGKWFYNGEEWKIEAIVWPEESSTQAARSAKAIADQWSKFGVNVEVVTLNGADLSTRVNMGDFQTAGTWDACSGYVQDFYNNISGWNSDVYSFDVGERAQGISSYRLPQSNPELASEIAKLVQEIESMDPKAPETREALTEYLKLTTEAHLMITVHAGTKIVPVNTTYWTGFPTAEDAYEGPWWWWSSMKFALTHLEPAQ